MAQIITEETIGLLRLRGYRVVISTRGEPDDPTHYSVQYPKARPRSEAFLGHYSLEMFTDENTAWAHAQADLNTQISAAA